MEKDKPVLLFVISSLLVVCKNDLKIYDNQLYAERKQIAFEIERFVQRIIVFGKKQK